MSGYTGTEFGACALVVGMSLGASLAHGSDGTGPGWAQGQRRVAEQVRETNIGFDLGVGHACGIDGSVPIGITALGPGGVVGTGGSVMDWDTGPGGFPVLELPVFAVILSDDDGGRRTPVSGAQISQWVDRANEVLGGSGIELLFDPSAGSGDWIEYESTLLNEMVGDSDPRWGTQRVLADAIAATRPEAMTVFFRWGPGAGATGAAFSWTDIDFIVMPGFGVTNVCGEQNIGLLAHEIGHYLGLPHTFRYIGGSVPSVEAFFEVNGNDPFVFDGDGRDETAPDPFVQDGSVQCGSGPLVLDGVLFELPRENAMSYYHPVSEFVESQSSTMRQTLRLRTGMGLSEDGVVIEPELSALHVTGGGLLDQSMLGFLGRWSGDSQVLWIDGEIGDVLSTTISVPESGRYRVFASLTCANDFGIVEHRINGQTSDPVDLYSRIVLSTGRVYLGVFDFEEGANGLEVEVVGVNPRSVFPRQGYGLDYLILERVCAADFDGDGALSFFDISVFLSGLGAMDPGSDFNGDGSWDFFDVSSFLSAYMAGCS